MKYLLEFERAFWEGFYATVNSRWYRVMVMAAVIIVVLDWLVR